MFVPDLIVAGDFLLPNNTRILGVVPCLTALLLVIDVLDLGFIVPCFVFLVTFVDFVSFLLFTLDLVELLVDFALVIVLDTFDLLVVLVALVPTALVLVVVVLLLLVDPAFVTIKLSP